MTNPPTAAAMPALLPCPFCGSTDISEGEVFLERDERTFKQSACLTCGAIGPEAEVNGPDFGDMRANAAWNRRARLQALAGEAALMEREAAQGVNRAMNCGAAFQQQECAEASSAALAPPVSAAPAGEMEDQAALRRILNGRTVYVMGREHADDEQKPLYELSGGMVFDDKVVFAHKDAGYIVPPAPSPQQSGEAEPFGFVRDYVPAHFAGGGEVKRSAIFRDRDHATDIPVYLDPAPTQPAAGEDEVERAAVALWDWNEGHMRGARWETCITKDDYRSKARAALTAAGKGA